MTDQFSIITTLVTGFGLALVFGWVVHVITLRIGWGIPRKLLNFKPIANTRFRHEV